GRESNRDSPSSGERTGTSLNRRRLAAGVVGPTIKRSATVSRSPLENGTGSGESLVGDHGSCANRYPSRVGHVKPGLNPGGPSPKAKRWMTTDSEPSRATERWEEPRQGRTLNLKPRAYKRWEGDGSSRARLTACLLHNDPASYCARQR